MPGLSPPPQRSLPGTPRKRQPVSCSTPSLPFRESPPRPDCAGSSYQYGSSARDLEGRVLVGQHEYADSSDDDSAQDQNLSFKRSGNRGQMEVSARYRSCTLLWVGCLSAYMAFLTSFTITIIQFFLRTENEFGHKFHSGRGSFPQTVSESVSDSDSPQGRLFFAFGLIAGICIFLSWYPFMLRNVYTGDDKACCHTYWIGIRQFVPSLGLLLLICVPTVPSYKAHDIDYFSVAFHLMGAGMMFIGYLLCELKCLEIFGFQRGAEKGQQVQDAFLDIEDNERSIRKACGWLIFIGFFSFLVAQVVLGIASDDQHLCCHDDYTTHQWEVHENQSDDTGEEGETLLIRKDTLLDTATGDVLVWKMISFSTECLAGLAMVTSHLMIWYYCEERHVEYAPHPLLAVWDEEKEKPTYKAKKQLDEHK